MKHFILITLFSLAACEVTGSKPQVDAGDVSQDGIATSDMDTDPATAAMFFETFTRPDYQPLPVQNGDTFELTTGFQGGWMLEIVIILADVADPTQLTGEYEYVVQRGDDVLLDASQPLFEWQPRTDGSATFQLFPEPLNIVTPDDIVGEEIEIAVTLRFDDGTLVKGTLDVTIVDDFEEANF